MVITGVGAVTPLALSAGETWEKLLAGQSGIDYISKFDTSDLRVNFAGEVRDFDPGHYMDRKEARRLDPYIQFAMVPRPRKCSPMPALTWQTKSRNAWAP